MTSLLTARGRRGRRLSCLLAFVSLSALASGGAQAADPATPQQAGPATTNSGLQDIVVTAQKRSQTLQSVPISVTALSGEQTRIERIATYDDLSRAVPGVSFDSSGTEGVTNISIRGVSSTAGSATVGLYLDDVSITVKNLFYEGSVEPHLADLDRIEVLRGPQGTLYGDSSEGGTIRYIAEAPNMRSYSAVIAGDLSNTYRGGQNNSESVDINVPVLPDLFAVRASASSTYDSGWINHYTQDLADYASVGGGNLAGKGVNSDHTDTVHITGKLTPGYDLTITPAFYYQHTYVNDSSAFYLNTPGLGLYDQDKEVQEYGRDTFSLASLAVRKGFGWADFTSITGLFQRDHARQEDGTYFNSTTFAEAFLATVPLPNPVNPNITPNDALNIIGNLPSAVKLNTHYLQFTQELRLSSPDNGPGQKLHWVGGLYFAQQTVHNTDFQQIPGINSTFLNLYGETLEQSSVEGAFNGGVPNTVLFPDDIDEYDNRTYKESQYSVFGQVDYDLLKDWRLGVGGRYEIAAEHFNSVEVGFYQIGNISPYHQQAKADSFTPKITLSHDITHDETVYASVGEGFRLGGPTGPITFGPNTVCAGDFAAINQTVQPTQFGSDSLWTYELGSKGRYFGNRLSLDGAAFYTDWRNIQQQIYLPTCGYYFTENVGDARIYGGELEAAFKVTQHLRLDANFSGESATITKSINPQDVPVGSNLIDVPQGTATVGATYSRLLADRLRLLARIDYAWTGHSNGSYQKVDVDGNVNLNYSNPAYAVLNGSLALSRDGYEVSLYAKNILNDHTIIQSPEINTVYEGYTVHPRVIGVTLKASF